MLLVHYEPCTVPSMYGVVHFLVVNPCSAEIGPSGLGDLLYCSLELVLWHSGVFSNDFLSCAHVLTVMMPDRSVHVVKRYVIG